MEFEKQNMKKKRKIHVKVRKLGYTNTYFKTKMLACFAHSAFYKLHIFA